jgi:hypothetical protein
MFSWLIFLFSKEVGTDVLPQVKVDEAEIEMIWVPDNWIGPIVAAPFDDCVF